MTCPECFGEKVVVFQEKGRARARICTCSMDCMICNGRGTIVQGACRRHGDREYETLAPCECRLRQRRLEHFNKAGVPAVLAHADFNNFKPEQEVLERARASAERFCANYQPDNPVGFVIAGPVGTGKSHLLAATVRRLCLAQGVRCQYVEMSFLFATIRAGFQENKSGGEIIAPLASIPVLAVDELGKGRGTQFEMDTLEELVSKRYNARLPTLFTTNYPLVDSEERAPLTYDESSLAAIGHPEALLERIGDRTFSRIREACELVQLPVSLPDWRRRIAAQRARSA